MIFRSATLLVACLASLAVEGQPAAWEAQLRDGNRLVVDPTSHRASVIGRDGVSRQIWDGVHRLEDGSTVTVRSGIMVPNRQILEPPVAAPTPLDGPSDCLVLVRKACGLHDECEEQESCGHARQLLQIEREEQAERRGSAIGGGAWLETTGQCREGLADETFFKACNLPQRGPVASPCERLVDRVCGRTGACDAAAACQPAHQLLEREYAERAASPYPDALTASSAECRQALQDQEFFTACTR